MHSIDIRICSAMHPVLFASIVLEFPYLFQCPSWPVQSPLVLCWCLRDALWPRLRGLHFSAHRSRCDWLVVPVLPFYCVVSSFPVSSCLFGPLEVETCPGGGPGVPLYRECFQVPCVVYWFGIGQSSFLVVLVSVQRFRPCSLSRL